MKLVLLGVALPFVGALASFVLKAATHRTRGFVSTGFALAALISVLVGGADVFSGEVLRWSWEWFPVLGIELAFYVDSLAMLFLLLISGIGVLVCLYAIGYLHEDRIDVLFWFSLLMFMGAMLGVVTAGDFITLMVFWELTSVSSFLLIGINYWKPESRRGALNALFITAAGGLCLLAGVLILANLTGSFSILAFTKSGLTPGPLATVAMVLILLGCWTKSAHFPFHFWLPQAMAAPTPVSAYLHSATMVKAGIYLMMRLNPGMESMPYWSSSIMLMGLLTFFVGGLLAISREDAKALLAYSTISQLGMITFLLGIGTDLAMLGVVFHILAHATFKGSLFMGAGAIDHKLGTRNLDEIGPLWDHMPVMSVVMGLCGISMAGLFFSGFVSKEIMFKAIFGADSAGFWILIGSVVASLFTFLYSLRFVFELPFGEARSDVDLHPHSMEPLDDFLLHFSPVVLCVGTVGLGLGISKLFYPLQSRIEDGVMGVATTLLQQPEFHYHFALWHGITKPLMVTGVVIFAGVVLYGLLNLMRGFWAGFFNLPGPESLNRVFQDNLVAVCHDFMDAWFIDGPLRKYLLYIFTFSFFVAAYTWLGTPGLGLPAQFFPTDPVSYLHVPFVLVMLTVLAILTFNRPVPAVIALGGAGFLISLIFLVYQAPDLILTQISVETVSIVIFLWVLKDIYFQQDEVGFRLVDAVVALAISTGVVFVLLEVMTVKHQITDVARYYIANAVPEAWGHNLVNVILVDFRALDTLGEIAVLAFATIGILAMMQITFNGGPEEAEE